MEDSPTEEPPANKPILNYADPQVGELRTIASFGDELEARLAASKLEGEEIFVVVEVRMPKYLLGPHPATLRVLSDEAAKAIEILKSTPARRCLVNQSE
jgi:hypothetical protein